MAASGIRVKLGYLNMAAGGIRVNEGEIRAIKYGCGWDKAE